jgi:hypothetical protein
VLVWVNPIQDGANRAQLDPLLREVAGRGIWVSAHPDVILRMGTKEVLYRTRDLGWGSDSCLYASAREFSRRFPDRLARLGRVVVKQGRGNGGNGVWKVELPGGNPGTADLDAAVRVQDARARNGFAETMTLGSFMRQCEDYFSWSGCLVDQAFQERLADGMLRCYFSGSRVVGFCRQWPQGLLDDDPHEGAPPASVMHGPDEPAYQGLRLLGRNSGCRKCSQPSVSARTSYLSSGTPTSFSDRRPHPATTPMCSARSTSAPSGRSPRWRHQQSQPRQLIASRQPAACGHEIRWVTTMPRQPTTMIPKRLPVSANRG